ncbi:Exocyst complex component SEC3 [Madurella mycetomatis]|uniref:Exocyst complex component SEC3 n=1 Tax=Madurella mycetomatis TaxID=100816 RepID=A0A175VVI6_9PEZI|nr:Exocyst complex component SEC3 [Madurella mycetomatis]
MAVLCPIALLLPTRGGGRAKSTLQNAVLGGGSFWGFNQLAHDYTGKSIVARSNERWARIFGSSSGNGKGGDDREGDGEAAAAGQEKVYGLPTEQARRNRALMEAERKKRAEAEGRTYVSREERERRASLWGRLWMGGEKEGWKERRLEEERQALERGEGYGELIMRQVREVWKGERGDRKEEGGDKKKD